jgi:hypothetical protein
VKRKASQDAVTGPVAISVDYGFTGTNRDRAGINEALAAAKSICIAIFA